MAANCVVPVAVLDDAGQESASNLAEWTIVERYDQICSYSLEQWRQLKLHDK